MSEYEERAEADRRVADETERLRREAAGLPLESPAEKVARERKAAEA